MRSTRFYFSRGAGLGITALVACTALLAAQPAAAQAPAAAGSAVAPASAQELERLVAPVALYPDDLVSIILPASTNPLQLVQAERFLAKRKTDPKTPIDDKWDDAVKSLVNYPEVVKQMSADLDWTSDLGEAVVADQKAVLDAVQAFRRKARSAGNLKSDPKQTIVLEKEVIRIVPADPQVIYVPQYNPTTVVVVSATPVYGYYPAPYPVYYYPYPPGAAFATGLIWGAAIGSAWNGGHYATQWNGGNNNITINRGNTNINTGNIYTGNVNKATQNTAWKSNKQPGQVASTTGRTASSARVGDARTSGVTATGTSATRTAGSTASSGRTATSGARVPTAGVQGNAFSGYGSGNAARADSSRGASSRGSSGGQGSRSNGGGKARAR